MNLYIGSNGYVCAIDISTGTEKWRTKLQQGLLKATSGSDVCVLVHENKVFAGSCGHLFCLSSDTGQVLWHNELKGMGNNDVTLAMIGQSIQYVTSETTRTHTNSTT
jgi:outer membrane protein assembly factor BamB